MKKFVSRKLLVFLLSVGLILMDAYFKKQLSQEHIAGMVALGLGYIGVQGAVDWRAQTQPDLDLLAQRVIQDVLEIIQKADKADAPGEPPAANGVAPNGSGAVSQNS